MEKPLISIVIPTYNRSEMLRGALQSLICQENDGKFSYEIVVVDNASTDATKTIFDEFVMSRPDITLRYVYEETKGHPHALSKAVKESRGKWIAFFDDDQLAEPDWLRQLYNTALQTGAPIVGGQVHLDLPREELSRLGSICRRELRENKFYKDVHRYEGKDLPGSGNVLVARTVFDSIGLFDSLFLTWASDSDFFLRARAAGFDMWYTPKAVIRHRIPLSRLKPENWRLNALMNGETLAYLSYKHKGGNKMLLLGILRIGQALFINLPLLFYGWIRRNQGEVLGRKCLLWRAEGYILRMFSLLVPNLFPQHRFFALLDLGPRKREEQ